MSSIENLGRMAALLDRSAVAGILIILILIARMLLKGEVPKHTFMVLWLIALARLLCPFSLDVSFSPFSVFGRTRTGMVNAVADKINQEASALYTAVALGGLSGPERVVPITPIRVIWATGVVVCALFLILTHVRSRRRFASALPTQDARVEAFLRENPLRRTVLFKVSDQINAPLTYGIVRPVVLLPRAALSGEEQTLLYVLTHEFIHVRRWDALTKLLMAIALCLHWFNPLCWVMLVVMNRDMELLCDALVLRRCGERARTEYPIALLTMEEKRSRMTPLCNGFSRGALEERVTVMMMRSYAGPVGTIAALIIAVVAVTALTQSAPRAVHQIVRAMDIQDNSASIDAGGSRVEGEDTRYSVGGEIAAGFYVATGEQGAALFVGTQEGKICYNMNEIAKRVGERKFVLYLEENAILEMRGKNTIYQITRGKVISDKTATVYVGSAMFRAGASVPVGSYSVSLMPGMREGSYAVLNVTTDGKSTTEVERVNLKEGARYAIHLEEGQIIEVRSGVLECNG